MTHSTAYRLTLSAQSMAAGDISWPNNGSSSVMLMVDAQLRINQAGMYRCAAGVAMSEWHFKSRRKLACGMLQLADGIRW